MTNEEQDFYYAWQFRPWFRVRVVLQIAAWAVFWVVAAGVVLGVVLKVARAI